MPKATIPADRFGCPMGSVQQPVELFTKAAIVSCGRSVLVRPKRHVIHPVPFKSLTKVVVLGVENSSHRISIRSIIEFHVRTSYRPGRVPLALQPVRRQDESASYRRNPSHFVRRCAAGQCQPQIVDGRHRWRVDWRYSAQSRSRVGESSLRRTSSAARSAVSSAPSIQPIHVVAMSEPAKLSLPSCAAIAVASCARCPGG